VINRADASNSKCAIIHPKVGFNQSSGRNTFLKRLINLTFGGISTLFLFRCVCPGVINFVFVVYFGIPRIKVKKMKPEQVK